MDIVRRPAVRIVCLDRAELVLLLQWRDPSDGSLIWEPPGGGIEPGETPYQAALRELVEETGLAPTIIVDTPIEVDRDTRWNGYRYVGVEPFFLARFDQHRPALRRDGLLQDEQENLVAHRWVHRDDLDQLVGRLQPPNLIDVVARLHPYGVWAEQASAGQI